MKRASWWSILIASCLFAGDSRKESTYTITSVMQFAKPFNFADMTDDYQDARLIAQDQDSITVELTYYPFNDNQERIGENPDWRRDDAGMTEYLRPTATENWDEKMRADLIAQLRADGIDPDQLTDRELVTKVSRWLMRRSRYNKAFSIWFVHYPNGKPEVFPSLRPYFDKEKPDASWTDQKMFDNEVLGREMFYNKVHGSCTSSSALIATVMRALGIPTRIIFCVPPADANDKAQREMLLSAVHHNQARSIIRHGLPGGGGDFANHLFNEVFIGKHWVRLNYDVLGQNILDPVYDGLLTHILTTDSISHVPLAETWGSRYAKYDQATPKLSSINPYRLISVSDHFGSHANIPNPEVDNDELKKVTISELYWKNALPAAVSSTNDPTGSDFYIGIQEYIPQFRLQLREFAAHAGHDFVLSSPGHPDLKVSLSGMKISNGDSARRYQLFGVRIAPESKPLLAAGVAYSIRPINVSETYFWTVRTGVSLLAQAAAARQPDPITSFEVATVKPNKSGDRHSSSGISSDRDAMKLTMTNVTLWRCIELAYRIKSYQIDAPDWLRSEAFDIVGTIPQKVDREQAWSLLQPLLQQRLGVRVHRETRVLPIYELVPAKSGAKVQPVEEGGPTGTWDSGGKLTAKQESMNGFASVLSRLLDRPVIDKTGLKGVFNFEMQYSRDDLGGTESSIFTALQETLGLKLEARKGPVEMLVVDHAERTPTEN